MRQRIPVLALAALALSGCFTYRPVTGTPPAGADLEAILSDSGTISLTARIGPNAASILGTFAGARGDTIDISIAEVRTRNGLTYYLKGTTIGLAPSDLAQLRVRQLDKGRTAVTAVAVVVGAAALASGVHALGGGDSSGGGGPPPPPPARPPE